MKHKKALLFFLYLISALSIMCLPFLLNQLRGDSLYDSVFEDSLSALPVQKAGRVMPLSSASADVLKSISGKSTFKFDDKKISSTHWLWLLSEDAEKMSTLPFLRTDNRKLQELLKADGRYVSYEAIEKNYKTIETGANNKDDSAYSKACQEMLNAFDLFLLSSTSLTLGSDFLEEYNDAISTAEKEFISASKNERKPNYEKLILANEFFKYLRDFTAYENSYNNEILKAIPVVDGFSTPIQVLFNRKASSEVSKKIVEEYSALSALIKEENFADAKTKVSQIFEIYNTLDSVDMFKVKLENIFNAVNPFFSAFLLFVIAFLLFGLSSLKKDVFTLPASAFFVVGTLVYVLAILVRMYIQMRPPVTNFYSSVVFTGAIASIFGLGMYLKKNSLLIALTTTFLGMLSLLVAINLSHSGDTMGMMRAVLNSNFWLSAHVMTIMMGYCGLFLAGFGASFRLVANVFSKKNFGIETTKTANGIYLLLCVCLLFTFMGTMLGGIWADMSWGRFWGWDPKENGALMIVLWTSATIHCKALKICSDRIFLVLTALGNVVVAWAWFGVNLLGVGLHSYGFIDNGWLWFIIYVLVQISVAPLGLVVYKGDSVILKKK